MDEKEQADRMAAAEALYMISTRVDKSNPMPKTSKRGRKKKNDYSEDISVKRKQENYEVSNSARRGRGKRGVRGGRGAGSGGRGGRGGRGGGSSPRGRGGTGKASNSGRGPKRKGLEEPSDDETFQQNQGYYGYKDNPTDEEMSPEPTAEYNTKAKSKSRSGKVQEQRKKTHSPKGVYGYSHSSEMDDDVPHQAIGLTGATISITEPTTRRSSIESSQNLPSLGLVSGLRQVSLASRSLSSTAMPVLSQGLPSINLTSFTADLNLPSIPVEIGSLQLSSQPTPNLSSLGDMGLTDGVMEDDTSTSGREKSEKFLPLKKRKLHNPSDPQVGGATPSMDTSSYSDSEERYEQISPPPQEPVRASFTVQAPPIITMQTLMEIKTALTADDDGDLPLHIAVVHENMRMVIKLINLMRIAGKGVDKFNKQQQTPLHLAVKLEFLEAVDILLRSGANINAVDCTGSSCVHMAVQGRSTKCLAMLLEKCPDADLNVRNFDGLTPLHISVDNGDLEQVEMLLAHNAEIDVTDGKSGRTSLFRAAESNQRAMVELLLKKGANPDVPNYAGVTTAMAAQGRNLHGVLKLLGSVPTDKFTEYDTKPLSLTMESKATPLYVGFQPGENQGTPPLGPGKGSNLSRTASSQEITCMIEPKHNIDKAELANNETKVFHNVFVVSQNKDKFQRTKSKSASEPSSPEVKMEVTDDSEGDSQDLSSQPMQERALGLTSGRSAGLMSLPEGILSARDDKSEEMSGKRRSVKVTARRDSATGHTVSFSVLQPTPGSGISVPQQRLVSPGRSQAAVHRELSRKDEPRPVMVQLIPGSQTLPVTSSAAFSTSVATSKPAPPNVLSFSSSSLSRPTVTVTLSTPSPSSNPVTLTSMQARLYQKLLEMYNIDPTQGATAASTEARRLGLSSSSSMPSSPGKPLSPGASSQQRTVLSRPFARQMSDISSGVSVSSPPSFEDRASSNTRTFIMRGIPLQVPSVRGGTSPRSPTETGLSPNSPHEKMDDMPLNLSKSSARWNESANEDTKMSSSAFSGASQGIGVAQSIRSVLTEGRPAGVTAIPQTFPPGPKGKIISIGVRKVSDTDPSGKGGSGTGGQYEMFLLPTVGQPQSPLPVPLGSGGGINLSNLSQSRAVTVPQSQGKTISTLGDSKKPVEGPVSRLSDFPHITKSVSPKTASIVRDFLSQQTQLRQQHQPLASVAPPSSAGPGSVPTVLSISDRNRAGHEQPVMTLTPHSLSGIVSHSPTITSPTTPLRPPTSSSPVFLHQGQGQVIDLSRSRAMEVGGQVSTSSPHSSPPSLLLSSHSEDVGQGKIMGFSGAILSVLPSKLERQGSTTSEKRPPKETTAKEPQKKRGRKSQKAAQETSLPVETGPGKINSETDEKLKKFLGAKKHEANVPVSVEEKIHDELEKETNGMEVESPGSPKEAKSSTYKTVGIFSGDVQHVQLGKRYNMATATSASSYLYSASTVLPSSPSVPSSLSTVAAPTSSPPLPPSSSTPSSSSAATTLSTTVANVSKLSVLKSTSSGVSLHSQASNTATKTVGQSALPASQTSTSMVAAATSSSANVMTTSSSSSGGGHFSTLAHRVGGKNTDTNGSLDLSSSRGPKLSATPKDTSVDGEDSGEKTMSRLKKKGQSSQLSLRTGSGKGGQRQSEESEKGHSEQRKHISSDQEVNSDIFSSVRLKSQGKKVKQAQSVSGSQSKTGIQKDLRDISESVISSRGTLSKSKKKDGVSSEKMMRSSSARGGHGRKKSSQAKSPNRDKDRLNLTPRERGGSTSQASTPSHPKTVDGKEIGQRKSSEGTGSEGITTSETVEKMDYSPMDDDYDEQPALVIEEPEDMS